MSCGICIVYGKASKQKLNTKITTESELVVVSKYVHYKIHVVNILRDRDMLYTKRFLSPKTIAIKMKKNGRNSCTGNSRHISIRYLFVEYRVDKDEFGIN